MDIGNLSLNIQKQNVVSVDTGNKNWSNRHKRTNAVLEKCFTEKYIVCQKNPHEIRNKKLNIDWSKQAQNKNSDGSKQQSWKCQKIQLGS